jgi:hypothetical protein
VPFARARRRSALAPESRAEGMGLADRIMSRYGMAVRRIDAQTAVLSRGLAFHGVATSAVAGHFQTSRDP